MIYALPAELLCMAKYTIYKDKTQEEQYVLNLLLQIKALTGDERTPDELQRDFVQYALFRPFTYTTIINEQFKAVSRGLPLQF